MAITRKHVREHNFILTLLTGCLDDDMLMEHVLQLNIEATGAVGMKELADCRRITDFDHLTVKGTTMCATVEIDKPGSELAILIPEGDKALLGLARAYQMFADQHRQKIRIFTDMHEALAWLADDPAELESLTAIVNIANKAR